MRERERIEPVMRKTGTDRDSNEEQERQERGGKRDQPYTLDGNCGSLDFKILYMYITTH